MHDMAELVQRAMYSFGQRPFRTSYRSSRSLIGVGLDGLPHYRVICPWCFGSGGADCVCRGAVLVCPECRGARVVRRESSDGTFIPAVPCPVCTDWHRRAMNERFEKSAAYRVYSYVIDRDGEVRAIARYLAEYPHTLDVLRALGISVDEWTI